MQSVDVDPASSTIFVCVSLVGHYCFVPCRLVDNSLVFGFWRAHVFTILLLLGILLAPTFINRSIFLIMLQYGVELRTSCFPKRSATQVTVLSTFACLVPIGSTRRHWLRADTPCYVVQSEKRSILHSIFRAAKVSHTVARLEKKSDEL